MLRDKAEEQSASNRSDDRLSYMIVLNDMEVSSEYILKLKAELEVRNVIRKPQRNEMVADLLTFW